jgi:NAD+ synthase
VVPDRLLAAPGGAGGPALPAPPALDAILAGLEGGQEIEALVAAGHDRAMVLRLRSGLMRAEALRRRAPPGVMLTTEPSAPRYPLTNGFTGPIG